LNAQICLAYAYGDGKVISCENAINAVSELFHGVPINSYFSFEIDSMPVLTDAIGGVDLTALETIGNFTEGEQVHLNSSNVESYLRSRRFDIIDASSLRQKRQMQFIQEYIKLAVDKTKSDITTPLNIYNTMKDYMVTNIGANKVTFLAGTYLTSGVDTAGITTLQGQTKMGETYVEFYPDEAAKLDLFIKTYYTKVTE
jgi:anionic cell wall polymer biosynthesis LytR-Cps2A-Psr (LCP) family protein